MDTLAKMHLGTLEDDLAGCPMSGNSAHVFHNGAKLDAFREQLSDQGLKYKAVYKQYPGDERMRSSTKLTAQQRLAAVGSNNSKARKKPHVELPAVVTPKQFKDAKKNDKTGRLCGDLTRIVRHINSIEECSGRVCGWCRDTTYFKCSLCGVAAHTNHKKGKFQGRDCFMNLHSDVCYGLGWQDKYDLFGGKKKEVKANWTPPSEEEIKRHARHIQTIQKDVPYRLRTSFESTLGDAATTNQDQNE